MAQAYALSDSASQARHDPKCAAAGAALAQSLEVGRAHATAALWNSRVGIADRIVSRAVTAEEPERECLLDHARLLRLAEKEAGELARSMPELPGAIEDGSETLRICCLARAYLDQTDHAFSESTCIAFLDSFQETSPLTMDEIAGLQCALQAELLDRLEAAAPALWSELVETLRQIVETSWRDVFDAVSRVDRILERDPAGAYSRMDFESRDRYRKRIACLATRSARTECQIAEAAVALAEEVRASHDSSRAMLRRTHVGYYLVDNGVARLEERIAYRRPFRERLVSLLLRWPASAYLISIELMTFLVVAVMLSRLDTLTPIFAGLLLLLLPATQTAVDFVNSIVTFLLAPRTLPKLDFSNGIPRDCTTMVAVPTLLLNEAQVRDLVLDLEIRFLANRGPNLYFALLTDAPDSDRAVDDRDHLVDVCRELIEGLNRVYPGSPFFLFHRRRVYNDSEGRWIGWERKRGKLLDLNRLLRGTHDAFPVKAGDLSVLRSVRYVITLDSDTQLPRDAAAKLVGTLAHPLNRAVVDSTRGIVVEGYGILQPRVGISIQSASRSRLAALYSGESGFDIYTRAISDVYQDLFGEGIFTGKGIYEIDVLREVLENRFPDNALLSHDLIEGAYARAALVSDIEVIDDYPSHFSAYNRRKHRWVRGDWQILRWILSRVPNPRGQLVRNPISVISRWKIADNLRRSLLDPATLILLLAAWFYLPGSRVFWTIAAIAMLFIPVYWSLLFALLRAAVKRRASGAWVRDTLRAFATGHAMGLFSLVFLLHQTLLSADAIVRTVLRVFVTRRGLLEWETAAESESAAHRKATVDRYLEWTPLISVGIALVISWIRPASLRVAAPVLVLWLVSRPVSAWLNRPPLATICALGRDGSKALRDLGEKICRYFHDWSSPATNWLIPDSVSENAAPVLRLSPTNLGMLLNARIAAVHLGVSTLPEFVHDTQQTLDRVRKLPKYRGHLLNWYDVTTLQAIPPRFVSTVDSGNLAAALWTLKQAALEFAGKHGVTEEVAADLAQIASACDRLVAEMDFSFLYNPRRRALSIGFDLSKRRLEPACYDLLASEARVAAFIAIAKGDIPQRTWFKLGRGHTLVDGQPVLLSWTGTMFEYLMPLLWMRHYPGTITEHSARGAITAQRNYALDRGVPWGISESACRENGGDLGYAPFGVPSIALKRIAPGKLVVAPYASLLAAQVEPAAALENLRQMETFGWLGHYGYYEAVEYSHSGADVIRSWMAHHQGMSLLAICNLLFGNVIQRYFHAEPHVMATELLLHERLPAEITAESQTASAPLAAEPVRAAG